MKTLLIVDKLAAALCVMDYPTYNTWCKELEYQPCAESFDLYSQHSEIAKHLTVVFTQQELKDLFNLAHSENI
jgi:hypothetical protein